MVNLVALAAEVHKQNVVVGWWDEWPVKTDRHETAMMLVVSELSEALEGDRKDLMDDHLPEFKAFGVELADAMIRLLDLAGAYETQLDEHLDVVKNAAVSWLKNVAVPIQLNRCVRTMIMQESFDGQVLQGIANIIAVAEVHEINLWKLVELKRAYNQKRADHKRKNRAADGGKKY